MNESLKKCLKTFLFLSLALLSPGCALYFDATSGLPDGFYRVNGIPFPICHPKKEKLVAYLNEQGFKFATHDDEKNHDIYINHETFSTVIVEKDWRISGGRRLLIGKVDWCYWYFMGYGDYSHLANE